MKNFSHEWTKITSDKQILDIALHCHIEFMNNIQPVRKFLERPYIFNKKEEIIIDNEVENLLKMNVIEQVESSDEQFLSPIFTVPKKIMNIE